MFTAEDQAALLRAYQTASSYLILLRSNPTFDQIAAGIALTLALQSARKQCHLACEQPVGNITTGLIGKELISQEVGNHSLQVSFDYSEDMVENVSYNIDKQFKKFHLVIRPKKGHHSLDPSTIEFSHVGIDADVIIMIGITGFDQIPLFYQSDEASFTAANTFSINKTQTTFAQTNIDISNFTSFCEWNLQVIQSFQIPLNSDIATDLLAGIESATNSFQSPQVTADTFEAVAQLMRAGAHRIKISPAQQSSVSSLAQAFAQKQPPVQTPVLQQPDKPAIQMPSQFSPSMR